jgi:hypothetical protein
MTVLPTPDSHDQAVRLERELWQRVGRCALAMPRRNRLRRGIGRDFPNEPADVAQLELLLGRAGYYDLDRREGPTGYWSPTIEDALRRYQKDAGLSVDGWAGPDGETVRALAGPAEPAAPPRPASRRSLLDDDGFQLPNPAPIRAFGNIPPADLLQGWIEIFPDQSGELPAPDHCREPVGK